MRVFLSGPMGSGKSTLGPWLARQLGKPFVDLDLFVEQQAGRSVQEIFTEEGESGFRSREQSAVSSILSSTPYGDALVALGGGTITNDDVRRRLLREGVLVTLMPPLSALQQRLGNGENRPLLATRNLESLLQERRDDYLECHAQLDTVAMDRQAILQNLRELLATPPLVVPLGRRTYRVHVGSGVRARLGGELDRLQGSSLGLVTDSNVISHWKDFVTPVGDRQPDYTLVLEPGEAHKNLQSVERVWNAALEHGADRQTLLLAWGGGVVGDLTGFAAATLLRGVRFVQMPTTLLAMVDSSVGGKTGFDHDRGKNLIGAFHQPECVLCDLDFLSTLPDREYRSGLAEVVKSMWLSGASDVAFLEDAMAGIRQRDPSVLQEMVCRSVALKSRIVEADEREAGSRRLLNLGHTVGHAIEADHGFQGLSHGESVALGMVAAVRISCGLGVMDRFVADRLITLMNGLGLPTDLDRYVTSGTWPFLTSDKKREGSSIHFVLPGQPGETQVQRLEMDVIRKHCAT